MFKSTLAHCSAMLRRAQHDSLWVDERSVYENPALQNRKRAFPSQSVVTLSPAKGS